MSKSDYILGRIQPLLVKAIENNDRYLAMLQQKKERIAAGGTWIEKTQTVDDINKIMEFKLKDQTEMIEVANLICKNYDGVCDDDQALLEFIKDKPRLLEKLQQMQKAADAQ
jgi:hypothetical protein